MTRIGAVVAALAALGGAARRHQLLRCGLTDPDLMAAVKAGRVTRPHRGCYALPDAAPVIVRARVMSAQLTCLTAARELDIPVPWEDFRIHLAVPADRGITPADRRRTREEVLHHHVPGARDDAPVAPVVRVLDHLARCVEPRFQLAAVDAALHRGLFGRGDLSGLTTTPLRQRRWLLAQADARAESMGETLARLEVRECGLLAVPQARLPGVGRVDLLVEGTLPVEIDGVTFHSSEAARREDARRDAALLRLGMVPLRIPHDAVLASPGEVARRVCARLGRAVPERFEARSTAR